MLGDEEKLSVLESCSHLEKTETTQQVASQASWLACLALLVGETSLEMCV